MTPTALKLSAQQAAVLSWARTDKGSLNLVARAGCGKTSTLLELVSQLVSDNKNTKWFSVFVGAYNRAIANEIQAKLQSRDIKWNQATANTMHGAGWGAWRKVAPNCVVEGKKVQKMLEDAVVTAMKNGDKLQAALIENHGPLVSKLISLAKQRAFGFLVQIEDRSEWYDVIDHFGLDEELEDGVSVDPIITFAIELYKASIALDHEMVDYDDMILAPLVHNTKMWQYDWVLIDEAQDTNPARRALAMKMLKPKYGRMVVVGDPAQAIYGFTGADSDSMNIIKKQMGSKELPLNLTYRCPKSIVRLAQQWVADIQAHETAPEGVVRAIPYQGETADGQSLLAPLATETLTKEDVILCRNTKPLIELAYSLLRRGVACKVEGREIASGLLNVIRKWKVTKITTLLDKLPDYKEKQIQKWMAKGKEEKAAQVEDVVDTIMALAQGQVEAGSTEVSQLVTFINSLFGDTKEGEQPNVLTLSTIHKSKGREFDRVYLLGRNKFMPSKYARKDWQMEQEDNLSYVAVTRAKKELVEVLVD